MPSTHKETKPWNPYPVSSMHPAHTVLSSTHCTVQHTLYCPAHTVLSSTHCTVQHTLYCPAHSILSSTHCVLSSTHCTVQHSLHCPAHSVLSSTLCTVHVKYINVVGLSLYEQYLCTYLQSMCDFFWLLP